MPKSSQTRHTLEVQRDTLIDFFRDLAAIRGEFLVYDDGYRRRSHTYADVGRAARGFAAKLATAKLRKGDKVVFWGENRGLRSCVPRISKKEALATSRC